MLLVFVCLLLFLVLDLGLQLLHLLQELFGIHGLHEDVTLAVAHTLVLMRRKELSSQQSLQELLLLLLDRHSPGAEGTVVVRRGERSGFLGGETGHKGVVGEIQVGLADGDHDRGV